MSLKQSVKRVVPRYIKDYLRPHLSAGLRHVSFSQEGEDLLIASLLGAGGDSPGFYVDIGAHHPHSFSNTFYFYRLGWRGINVDAMPGSMKLFRRFRPRDINIETAISDEPADLKFYELNYGSMSGFIADFPALQARNPHLRILREHTIHAVPLKELLAQHLPLGQSIDFLSVDVEGHDLAVLQSNDWTRFRPAVVVVEDLETRDLAAAGQSQVSGFMQRQGYIPVCRLRLSTAFADKSRIYTEATGVRVNR